VGAGLQNRSDGLHPDTAGIRHGFHNDLHEVLQRMVHAAGLWFRAHLRSKLEQKAAFS
jgi:hypothetical protein